MSTCISPAWTNAKNAVKMSFLAGPNQKLHTDAFDAGDQRPPRWISIWSSETWKKSFSQKLKISLLQSEKSLFISLKLKKRKKHFLVKSALSFQPVTAKRLVKGFLKWNQWKGNRILPIKIFSDKNIFEGRLSNWGRKTKSVHFCTLRNRVNFTRAGTNGLTHWFRRAQSSLGSEVHKKCALLSIAKFERFHRHFFSLKKLTICKNRFSFDW